MAVTRIKNNQITDSTITYQKIASGTLVGSLFNANLALNSNVTITGNLTVTGNTTTVNSIDTTVNDPLIVFNSGYVGTPSYDVGFLVDRSLGSLQNYGGVNAALIWSENDGAFITVLTTETGATKGAVSKNFKANLITGNLTVSNTLVAGSASFSSINNTPVGNTTPALGRFTYLTADTGFSTANVVISGGYISSLANAFVTDTSITTGYFGSLNTANAVISGGYISALTNATVTTASIGTGTVGVLNTSAANIAGSLFATSLNTANAVIGGGYISALTNATVTTGSIGTLTATVLNSSAANVAGALFATSLNTANAVISGGYISALSNAYVTTGLITNFSTANARITGGNITMATTAGGPTYVTADHVEGFDAQFGNIVATNTVLTNVIIQSGSVTGITNFATSFGNILTGYADSFKIGANTAAPASFTTANVSSTFKVTDTTESTSSTTGAVIVSGGLGVAKNIYAGGNVVIDGNLTVRGTTTNVDSVDLVVADSTIRLHTFANSAPLTTNDGRDIGIIGDYYLGADKNFFFGRINSSGFFEYYADATESGSNVVSGTYGTVKSGELVISNTTAATNTISGAITVAGGVGIAGSLYAGTVVAGSINSTPIGNATPSTGAFTTITATSTLSVAGTATLNSLLVNNEAKASTINGTANVYLAPQSGSATVTINPLVIGAIDNMSIGATTAANAYVSNFRAATSLFAAPTGTVWLRGGTGTSGINNIPIGAVTPAAGTFTTVAAQTTNTTTLNATDGNVTTAYFGSLNTANAVIGGGYISALTNATIITASVGTGTATTLNATAGNITTGYFGSLNTANAVIGGGYISALTNITVTTASIGNLNGTGNIVLSTGNIVLSTGNVVISSGNATIYTEAAGTANTRGALVITGTGGAAINGNVYVGQGAVINGNKTVFDTIIKGANENSLILAHAATIYDQVVIGGNIATANITLGAKLQVASQDSLLVPVGPSSERPSSKGYTDVDGMLRFNSTSNQLEYYGNGAWNNTGSVITIITARTFSNSSGDIGGNVNGSNTTFTLNANATSSGTLVTINGVMQIPITAYSISGTTLTFTEAPAVGDVIDTRILATTSTVDFLTSEQGFNQFVANNTSLSFYTGNVLVGSVENWRIDTNGDFYPVTSSNIGSPTNRVDYLFASNINLSGGTISGVALTGGPIDNTPIGGNVGNTGNFTTLTANVFQANTSVTIIAGLMTIDNTANTTVVGGTTGIIDSFDKAVLRSGKYFVQVSDETAGEYQSAEVICVHNGTTATIATYGVTFTGAANLVSFSANISGNDVNLLASPVGNVNIKTFATLMKI